MDTVTTTTIHIILPIKAQNLRTYLFELGSQSTLANKGSTYRVVCFSEAPHDPRIEYERDASGQKLRS